MIPSEHPIPPADSPRSIWWLVAAIVAGVLIGAFYGQAMWLASDGPQKSQDKIAEILKQKKEKIAAEKAIHPEVAERLTAQIPTIEAEQKRLAVFVQQAQDNRHTTSAWVAKGSSKLLQFCGEIFLRMLKCLVLPLVVTSMICGITSLGDIRRVGRLGGWTLVYFLGTTGLAVFIGLILVQTIRPGVDKDDTFAHTSASSRATSESDTLETLLGVVRGRDKDPGGGMIPENLFQAAVDMNVMGLIIFSLFFGGALTVLGDQAQPVISFFNATNEAILKMVHLVMLLAPVGILGLLAASIARRGGGGEFLVELSRLAYYALAVLLGLAIHTALILVLLWFCTGRSPLAFTAAMSRALITAVSTSSSSATLPVTLECAEEKAGISPQVSRFVIPLGATVNMNGTALYEAVAVVFIAQSLGMELSIGQLVVVMLTATLAAVGAAGIPEAGLVTMVMVLTAVGLPVDGIGTILAIDWFLDRIRTSVNVYGDVIGAAILDKYLRPASSNKKN